jgi:hypothetical protein
MTSPDRSAAKPRRFFVLGWAAHARPAGLELLNKEVLFGERSAIFMPPELTRRGFRDYPARPAFRISTRLGRRPDDIERMDEFWLVSAQAKQVLAGIAGSDFWFLPVDTIVEGDETRQTWFLCDVVTMLDAIDEPRSRVRVSVDDRGERIHLISPLDCLAFDETVVGTHRLFRLTTNFRAVICDDVVRSAVRSAKLKGLMFRDARKT